MVRSLGGSRRRSLFFDDVVVVLWRGKECQSGQPRFYGKPGRVLSRSSRVGKRAPPDCSASLNQLNLGWTLVPRHLTLGSLTWLVL